MKNMLNLYQRYNYLEKIGIKYTITLDQGQVLKLDHMHRNSSINYQEKANLIKSNYLKLSSHLQEKRLLSLICNQIRVILYRVKVLVLPFQKLR